MASVFGFWLTPWILLSINPLKKCGIQTHSKCLVDRREDEGATAGVWEPDQGLAPPTCWSQRSSDPCGSFRRDLAMSGCKWMIFNDSSEMSVLLCLVIFCWFEVVCHLPFCFQSACISDQDAIPDTLRSPAPVTCKLCGLWCHSSMTTADMWGAEVQWLPSLITGQLVITLVIWSITNWKTIQDDSHRQVRMDTYERHWNIYIYIYWNTIFWGYEHP